MCKTIVLLLLYKIPFFGSIPSVPTQQYIMPSIGSCMQTAAMYTKYQNINGPLWMPVCMPVVESQTSKGVV